jgi:cell wall-associated NlpC family hydrolase
MIENSAAADRVRDLFDQRGEEYDAASRTAEEAARTASTASETAERALATARTARDTAQAQARAATATATRVARRRTVLVREVARLEGISVRVAQRRQDAFEAVPAAAPAVGGDPAADPGPTPSPEPVPAPEPSGGARAAIAYARAQLGEPYRWGAAGPSAWDCSGLTSKAWAAGGKSLPHYSVAQYDSSTPVSAAQLRPGDLVFWGDGPSPSSIYHVALYVGDGRIIHAPRTGRPVTEESIGYWRTPDFYARP